MPFIDEILDKVNTGKDSAGKDRSNRSKAAIACVMAGIVVGLMIGSSKKWNLFYSAAGGGLIGGVVGGILTPGS